ncbi:hypothetical protein KZO01_19870 [Kurthia zopfii]|uniref:Pesticidal crystal protein Cry1Aa domain-containing protein n=1 Tax=Kurthia zopfii TaxID=1650 RepID=A0ABY2EQ60_9BACL|nr:toxin Cry1Ac domain D-VI-related protein [Kurthia zopfii]TDR38651.1 hypothetical protein DFR61_11526 [Kurthia zopfii]GEK31678.1 hypothetical protein KZO01_19870 [Kurthia zopfii]
MTSKGNYYKKGKLGTGSYKGIYYSVGKKLTGLTSKGVYYKNGKLGNGVYKDVLYKSGKPFNGTLKDEVYVNGKVDANKTANLVFSNAQAAFNLHEASFKSAQKQVEDLTSLAKKAGVTPAKAASLQVKSATEIQDFIAKYSNTDFKTLSAAELDAFKAELSKCTAEATTNLEAVSKLVNDSTMSLLSAISAMKSFATEEQKAEFTKLTTQANIVIHALKAAGVDTSKLEDALKQTDIKVPEIETPGTGGGTETPGTGTETPGTGGNTGGGNTGGGNTGGGNTGGGNTGGGNTGGGNTGGGTVIETPEEVAKKEFESATKALAEKQDAFKEATEQQTSLKAIKDKLDAAQSKTPIEPPVVEGKSAKLIQSDAAPETDAIKAFIDKYKNTNFTGLNPDKVIEFNKEYTAVQKQVTDKLNAAAKDLVTTVSVINKAVEKLTPFATPEQQAAISTALQTSLEAVKAVEEAKVELEGLQDLQNKLKKQAIENAMKVAEAAVKALETNPTQEKIDAAQAAVDALLALDKDYDVKAFNSAIAEAQKLVDAKTEKENIEKATNAVNALFSDENKTVIADSVVQNTINEAKKLVENLKDSQVKTELEGKIISASTQLKKALESLKTGLSTDGQIVVEDANKQIDELFTFQMAGIALVKESESESEKVTAFDRNATGNTLKESKTLTTAQMNEGILATLERINADKLVTLDKKNPPLNIESSQKHGYTVFTVTANNFSKEIFDKLDGNKNNAYLITVNNKVAEGISTKAYKILFQVIDGKVEAKFVESTVNDDKFSIDAATDAVNALFSDDNTLSLDIDEAKISAAKILVDKIKDSQKSKDLSSKLETASKLLVEKEIAELEKGIQADGSLAVKGENLNFDDVFTFQMAGIALDTDNTVTAFSKLITPTNLKEAKTLTTTQMNEGILATLERINAAKPVTLDENDPSLNIVPSQKHGYTVFTVTANNFSKEIFDKLDGPVVTGDGYYTNRYNITVNPKSPSNEAPFILKLSSDNGNVKATFEAKRVKTKQ